MSQRTIKELREDLRGIYSGGDLGVVEEVLSELLYLRLKIKRLKENDTKIPKGSCGIIMSSEDTYCVKHGYSKCP